MSLILDLVVLALIVLGVVMGIKRGFVRTAIELIGYVLVLVIATTVAVPVSEAVYDGVFRDTVEQSVSTAISESATGSVEPSIDAVFENIPDGIRNLLDYYTITPDSIKDTLDTHVDDTSGAIAVHIADALAPPIQSLIRLVFVALLFIVGIFAVRLLAKLCNSVAEALPLVGRLNSFLGGFAGGLKGLAIAFFVANLISLLIGLTNGGLLGITQNDVDKTVLFMRLCTLL